MIYLLKRNIIVKEDIICGNKFIHVRCCVHIINLIVAEGLKEVDESLFKIYILVRYMKASPKRLGKFNAIAKQLEIHLLVC